MCTGYRVTPRQPARLIVSPQNRQPAPDLKAEVPVTIEKSVRRKSGGPVLKIDFGINKKTRPEQHFANFFGVETEVLDAACNQLRTVVEEKYESGCEYLTDPERVSGNLLLIRNLFPLGLDALYVSFLECWTLVSLRASGSMLGEGGKVEELLRKNEFANLKEEAPALFAETLKNSGYQKINLGPITNTVHISTSSALKIDEDFLVITPSARGSIESSGFGFQLIENFLDADEMATLMKFIDFDESSWVPDMEHKSVQVFGYNYLDPEAASKPIPSYCQFLLDRMRERRLGSYDQLIISDYPPGIGLEPHVDRLYWDERIVGISLLSSCVMTLTSLSSADSQSHVLRVGSLYVLDGKSRYAYSHAIPAETVVDRRVSLTFRNLAAKPIGLPEEIAKRLKLDEIY